MLNKKRIGSLFGIVFLSFLFISCGNEKKAAITEKTVEGKVYEIYCLNTAETKIQSVKYIAEKGDRNDLVQELIQALSTPPETIGLKQAIPDDISILSFSVTDDTVVLDFDESYQSLRGVGEVLRRAAVVKTLSQIKEVKYVKYTVSEQPLLYSDMTPMGSMKADDFIDNTSGETTYYQTVHLTLYYTNETGEKLQPARHNVEFDGTISLENLVLNQLINGPLTEEKLMPVIPEGTKLNKVSSKDGICYVDFSKEFLTGIDGVSNSVIIYSIVNSLSEIGSVTKVLFTIDGEEVSNYRGEIQLDIPLERKLEIIETK